MLVLADMLLVLPSLGIVSFLLFDIESLTTLRSDALGICDKKNGVEFDDSVGFSDLLIDVIKPSIRMFADLVERFLNQSGDN